MSAPAPAAMLPFALTLFASAFLLFAVQPLVGKYILPWFGGGPGVWTTCLLFFQTLLLGGYLYAHLSATRLSPRRQVLLHFALLAVALVLLPIAPAADWKPVDSANPIGRILVLLLATVGLPYFVLSATGPLLQHWFGQVHPGRSPYRLYALSNAGSLLALIGYPFYFERFFTRPVQSSLWSAGLGGFALLCAWCAWRVWRAAPATATPDPASSGACTSPLDRLLWFSLAAVASILLLSTTNQLCQDLAVIPFLWVLPLALYLLSFILCFDHPRWYSRAGFSALFALGALVDVYLLFSGHHARLAQQITGYSVALFAACMLCHGELFRLRPATRELTAFYLHLAAGGAAGAFVVAVIAPLAFDRYLELQLGLWLLSYLVAVLAFRHRSLALAFGTATGAALAALVVPALSATAKRGTGSFVAFSDHLVALARDHGLVLAAVAGVFLLGTLDRRGWLRAWRPRAGAFLLLASVALGILVLVQLKRDAGTAVATSRDFYGVLKVFEHERQDRDLHYYSLVHGATSHGLQFAEPPQADWPTTYYGETSGFGRVLAQLPPLPRRRLGLVGLGTGTIASYGRVGDVLRIYEIDPQVERLARSRFTYLARSPARIEVVMGDARLSLERELARGEPQQFDVLALDAFSSDAIPVHLLTAEAFSVYLRHLRPDGVLAIHTSNRYLDLRPVVENLARHFGLASVTIADSPPAKKWWLFRTTWILVTRNAELLARDALQPAPDEPVIPRDQVGLWTDDHSSIYEILR